MNLRSRYLPSLSLFLLLLCLLFLTLPTYGQILNGDFEDWSGGQPAGWEVIDSGILVSSVTSPVSNGTQAAQITVATSNQSLTDFAQTVDLVADQTYQFQTAIFHTEGGVRARMYVNGYRNYSDPSLINQWQQLRFTYTPTQNESIRVGLRFYDVSGFDGSEIVYVDEFSPTGNNTPVDPPSSCDGTEVSVNLTTDNYASETSWQLLNANSQIVSSGDNLANNTTYVTPLCLDPGDYQFTISDSYGDGICCAYGSGEYSVVAGADSLVDGGQFAFTETRIFTVSGGGNPPDLSEYYQSVDGLTAYALKTGLYELIKAHSAQGYGALWGFYAAHELDVYFENDGSILDIYSENPFGTDSYRYTSVSDQCGTYNSEADCYNREHSFPRSWFGGAIEPMNSDVHHIFASDGYVNSKRGSLPYGEVGTATFTSNNGSKAGAGVSALGYSGNVFEPIDEFKGDVARAQFYVATRYQSSIGSWQNNSSFADAVLNGSSSQVFESWYLSLLKNWHQLDPVSQKELDRNNAAHVYQGNRNPFVDYPEFVNMIWGSD